jgi:RNA polymerase sigma-70 factor (ECF subfamily)
MDHAAQFDDLRPSLFSLAYRMLGTRADAEDIVQEAWLRWQAVEKSEVVAPKAFLTTVVARLALDTLKSATHKRETYIGPWLPEPILEPQGTRPIEMAESLSIAFLHVLESLSPAERVAFLMREVFDAEYSEIAAALETSEANCRQLVTRARKRVREGRPRFAVDRGQHQDALKSFLEACASGDTAQLLATLTDDAVLYSDGGGKVQAAINPIYGPHRIARFFAGIVKRGAADGLRVEFLDVNGEPGVLLLSGKRPVSVVSIARAEDGRISRIFLISNPDKL